MAHVFECEVMRSRPTEYMNNLPKKIETLVSNFLLQTVALVCLALKLTRIQEKEMKKNILLTVSLLCQKCQSMGWKKILVDH